MQISLTWQQGRLVLAQCLLREGWVYEVLCDWRKVLSIRGVIQCSVICDCERVGRRALV